MFFNKPKSEEKTILDMLKRLGISVSRKLYRDIGGSAPDDNKVYGQHSMTIDDTILRFYFSDGKVSAMKAISWEEYQYPTEAHKEIHANSYLKIIKERDALWNLLDDIDTLDDMCKNDDKSFRNSARSIQLKRHEILTSYDGRNLVRPMKEEDLKR